jgi:hypothetical protein
MKEPKVKSSDTSGYNSSTLKIDVTTSASNSTYQVLVERRVIKVESEA